MGFRVAGKLMIITFDSLLDPAVPANYRIRQMAAAIQWGKFDEQSISPDSRL
jgi:hypothetical protein